MKRLVPTSRHEGIRTAERTPVEDTVDQLDPILLLVYDSATLDLGTRFGPYEILGPLGSGGMGDVYRARDTRLDRIVAIKVLRDGEGDRPEWRGRFEREARTIASLNHPHICTLYDVHLRQGYGGQVGTEDGIDFLVMEYLEGETLAARLTRGPLPLPQVLQYAAAISDALDKAHRKGITHRDLKPGNIIITKAGPKLLDFGLARHRQGFGGARSDESALTEAKPLTQEGTILGTLPYMAPEQLEGKEADARTDIFAFGTLVYEMVTARRAFEGGSSVALIASILEHDAPALPHPPLNRVVQRCLAKDPEERWQSAGDLTCELKWIAEGGGVASAVPRASGRLYLGGAFLITAAMSGAAVWFFKPAPSLPVTRAVITLADERLAGADQSTLALSPDGRQLAYVAIRKGTQQIYLRSMDSLESKAIAGTEGAVNPFFSPDGEWLGFAASGKLKKISVDGGVPITLGDAVVPRGASWSKQGTIVFAPIANGVLQQVAESGGVRSAMTRLEKGDSGNRWPMLLPGGKAVLFAGGSTANPRLAAQAMGTSQQRNLLLRGTYPRYLASGHLVFAEGGNLIAVPFDPVRLEVTGAPIPVVHDVLQSVTTGAAGFSVSDTGSLVYVSGRPSERRLVWVDRAGNEEAVGAPARAYASNGPRLSPDGQRLAVPIEGQIWLYDFARETLGRLTLEGQTNVTPTWTPDGSRVAFSSMGDGAQNLFWQSANGSDGAERLTRSENQQYLGSFSPDGQLLAFAEIAPETVYDLWALRLDDRKAEPFLRTPVTDAAPRFSPDGRWLAYASDESGSLEIYVRPYPGPGGKWQISSNGGVEAVWNPNGRELFYREGDKMMAVAIETDPGFSAGKPTLLFERRYAPTAGTLPNFDVSRDGQRFLMIKESEPTDAITQINVVLNWSEELKRRVRH